MVMLLLIVPQLSVQGETSMTDQERKAMEMALEALEDSMYPQKKQFDAIVGLKQALAQPEQEPVAWKDKTYGNLHNQNFGNSIPLYTAPPSKQWVSLTDEEIAYAVGSPIDEVYLNDFRKVEAALRKKNDPTSN